MRRARHSSGGGSRVRSRALPVVAIASLAVLLGGLALGDAGCAGGYERCPLEYREPSTPAEREVARVVDAYVSAVAARDLRRACAEIAPRVKRSPAAWQESFGTFSPWLRCGEDPFLRREEAGPLLSHRATNIEFLTADRQRDLRRGQAVAGVEQGSRTAWVFFLERSGGRWQIVGMSIDDCGYVPG